MEREELLQQVNESIEADGKQLSATLSEESINGELDDALEDITDDEENNKKVVARLAKRLLRMDGNLHSNVSKEVNIYKKKHPAQKPPKDDDNGGKGGKNDEGDDDMPAWAKKLTERLDKMDERSKAREAAAAKDAIVTDVKKGFKTKFKEAGLEINDYIFRQTLRDLDIPENEDGQKVNIGELVKTLERDYLKNLKDAGLDKKDTGKSRFGSRTGNGKGESAADRFFAKKGKKEGWKK